MISSSWFFFMRRLLKLNIIYKKTLTKTLFEHYLQKKDFADKQVKLFLENKINEKSDTVNATKNIIKYYKLAYIGHISANVKRKIKRRFCKYYRKSLNIKTVPAPFKVANMFNVKDPIPKSLKSFVVYKFVRPACNACYIGETTRHLSPRIKRAFGN